MTLRLKSTVNYTLINPEGSHRRYVMLSIDVPTVQTRRQPLNLALVVDRSGSMGGGKLERAKEAARQLVRNLTPQDRVALVAFASEVDVLAHSTTVTHNGRTRLLGAIDQIRTAGSTALHGGWWVGGQQVADFVDDERVSRVLLLTDGRANVGLTDPELIAGQARELRQRGIETSAMGIGADFDDDLLKMMASSGGGAFHFIPDAPSIEDVVAGELGEMISQYARRTVVDVSLPRGVELRGCLNKYELDQTATGARVYIGDLLSGDLKRIVLKVSTPPGSIGEHLSITSKVVYTKVETNQHRDRAFPPAELRYAPVHAVRSQPVNRDVDREVSLLRSARARDEAVALSRDGRHEDALKILRVTAGKLSESSYASEPEFAAEAAAVRDLVSRAEQGPLDELRRKDMVATSRTLRERKARHDKGLPK
ncbi:MAG: VWA domain-containing protein [Chloroflexia bacterium]|nr:VWA domain-containing protein [Chloroflexia bacterium]